MFRFLRLLVLITALILSGYFVFFISDIELPNWKTHFAMIVLAITLILLILKRLPVDMVMLFSATSFLITGILTPHQFALSFVNETIITIAMLCIITRATIINGLIEIITTKKILELPTILTGPFLNHTPLILRMIPIVENWTHHPSKFLLPLSYITLLAGMLTLIGTFTNIIIKGLLQNHNIHIGFFEPAYLGIPLTLLAILYLTFAKKLLPNRSDVSKTAQIETKEYTAEFIIERKCPLANKKIHDSSKLFPSEVLIRIERKQKFIDAPNSDFILIPGDRLVFAGDKEQIKELHTIPGLTLAPDPHFKIDTLIAHFSEIMIPTTSLLVGKTLKRANFRKNYGASVFALYRQGQRVTGNVSDTTLNAGDSLMLISSQEWTDRFRTKDFYIIQPQEKTTTINPYRISWIITLLIAMITLATLGISLMITTIAVALLLLLTRTITPKEAQNSIMWNTLLLIASAFALAKGIAITQVAQTIAQLLFPLIENHLITGLFLIGLITAELISGPIAALLLFPIALHLTHTTPEAIKTIAITIAFSCSCTFALPTAHTIAYAAGGYKLQDFLKIGLPLDIIIFITATILIPYIWPISA